MHITPAGGNVFADLGFEPEAAAALKARSQRIISGKLAVKDSGPVPGGFLPFGTNSQGNKDGGR